MKTMTQETNARRVGFNGIQFKNACIELKRDHPDWRVHGSFYVCPDTAGAIKYYTVHLYVAGSTHQWYGQADDAYSAKAEAVELLLELVRQAGDNETPELDAAIDCLLPRDPGQIKTLNKWLASACDLKPDNGQNWKQYVHVVAGVASACDGHRIHYCDINLPNGAYNPLTLEPVDFDGRAPNFEPVKADTNSMTKTALTKFKHNYVRTTFKSCRLYDDEGAALCAVNQHYFLNATSVPGDVEIYFDAERIAGSHKFGNFTLMGLRL